MLVLMEGVVYRYLHSTGSRILTSNDMAVTNQPIWWTASVGNSDWRASVAYEVAVAVVATVLISMQAMRSKWSR